MRSARLLLAVLAGCGSDASPPDAAEADRRPSFVLIVADTLRADALGPGAERPSPSPALDAFAAESVVFTSAFAQAPWTKPSVASLLTGLHPQAHGVMNHDGLFFGGGEPPGGDRTRGIGVQPADRIGVLPADRIGVLPADVETLAEAMSGQGYASAAFVANDWLSARHGFDQGFDDYEVVPKVPGAVFSQAEDWLAKRDPGRPFFLYLHGMEVHGPYQAPEPLVEVARSALGAGGERTLSDAEFSAIPAYLRAPYWVRAPAARDLREWRVRYAAGVVAFDRFFGRFVSRGRDAGWLDRSVVVVTSDHGEELFDHGGWNHGRTLFDEQLRVPLMVRLPGGRHAGRRVDTVTSLVDLKPTLLALTGSAEPPDTSAESAGRSLLPLLRGETGGAAPAPAIASASVRKPSVYALRTDRHKLVLDVETGAVALFDLAADPGEQREVAADQPEAAARLERALRDHVAAMRAARPGVATAPIDPEMRARLEALGYADAGAP